MLLAPAPGPLTECAGIYYLLGNDLVYNTNHLVFIGQVNHERRKFSLLYSHFLQQPA